MIISDQFLNIVDFFHPVVFSLRKVRKALQQITGHDRLDLKVAFTHSKFKGLFTRYDFERDIFIATNWLCGIQCKYSYGAIIRMTKNPTHTITSNKQIAVTIVSFICCEYNGDFFQNNFTMVMIFASQLQLQ